MLKRWGKPIVVIFFLLFFPEVSSTYLALTCVWTNRFPFSAWHVSNIKANICSILLLPGRDWCRVPSAAATQTKKGEIWQPLHVVCGIWIFPPISGYNCNPGICWVEFDAKKPVLSGKIFCCFSSFTDRNFGYLAISLLIKKWLTSAELTARNLREWFTDSFRIFTWW